jgi:hypothetical protein
MPVIDEVIFGPGLGAEGMTYGYVRKLDDDAKLQALKRRVDKFFVEQVDELGKSETGSIKVYSPFPLALLTCVGIETLGQIMYYDQHKKKEEGQKEGFVKVAKSLHPKFSRPLRKTDKQALGALLPGKEAEKVESIAHILYYFQRNTLIHGYQSRAVYLTEDLDEWELNSGALLLNPYWFWQQFKFKHNDLFGQLFANVELTNALRKSALHYLSVMLG